MLFLKPAHQRGELPNVYKIIGAEDDNRVVSDALKRAEEWRPRGHTALHIRDVERQESGCRNCMHTVLNRFDPRIERRRIVLACVMTEAWMLADEDAVNLAYPRGQWVAPARTDDLTDPKATLRSVVRRHFGSRKAEARETAYAEEIGARFVPERAEPRSPSFARLMQRLRAGP